MYKDHRILVTICARGGSKGIPGKNIRPLAGKPLIAHTIQAAKNFGWADRILVSTDDDGIKAIAQNYGAEVPFLRPKKLANDTIGRIAAVIHTVKRAERFYKENFDIIVDLGNMSPLRTPEDIRSATRLLVESSETDVVYSVTPAGRNPYYNQVETDHRGYAVVSKRLQTPPSSRQQAPTVYDMNDSIYVIWKKALIKHSDITVPIQLVQELRHRIFVMPEERSVDVDRLIDFQFIELLLNGKNNP